MTMNNNEQQYTSQETTTRSKPKTEVFKKWWFWAIIAVLVILIIASGSGSDSGEGIGSNDVGSISGNQGSSKLGDYEVVISGARLASDWEGKPVVIVKYTFTNNADEPSAFWVSVDDSVFQNGIGLNECYLVHDSANYSSDNQMKEIKKGATLDVEVAYTLNDTTTPIDVEVCEYFSLSDKKIKKTFNLD